MSHAGSIAFAAFAAAAVAMLLVTQSKTRVAWPAWIVPATAAVAVAAGAGFAIGHGRLPDFWAALVASPWGLMLWVDRLAGVTAAFFLLQNRARAAGMKSEVWVLAVIFTGSIGLLAMLARTLQLEARAAAAEDGSARTRPVDRAPRRSSIIRPE